MEEEQNGERLLFMGNLDSQRRRAYIDMLLAWKTVPVFGPERRTESWQPVDRGHIGATLQSLARMKQAIAVTATLMFLDMHLFEVGFKHRRHHHVLIAVVL